MSIPADLKYTKDHEWVRMQGDTATFGITDHAQEALGDIVFVELPEVGRQLAAGEAYAVVESVKAVSDVYAPVAGVVTEVNADLESQPDLVNSSPYGGGWIVQVKTTGEAAETLMDEPLYSTFLEE